MVMRMKELPLREGEYLQPYCQDCDEELHRQPDEEEEDLVQAKEAFGLKPELTLGIQARIDGLKGGGQPLPAPVRSFFEPRFGYDFSRVRIHNDARAAVAA